MESLIEEMFRGNLNYGEQILPTDPAYDIAWEKIAQKKEYLEQKLPPEDREQLERLEELYCDIHCIDLRTGFAHGVKVGARLSRELFEDTGG